MDEVAKELFEKVYREYADSVFHIDVYDKTTAERILTLADEYDMKQRCVILSDDPEILSAVALNGGASAYTGVINVWDGRGRCPAVPLSVWRSLRPRPLP